MEASTLRPLGPHERWFWLMNKFRPNHFVIAAQILGTASRSDWMSAADAVAERHPLLGAEIVERDGTLFFQTSTSAGVQVSFENGDAEKDLLRVASVEAGRAFGETDLKLARITIIEGQSGTGLVLALHHAIADGVSGLSLINDLLAFLSGTTLEALHLADDLASLRDRHLGAPAGQPAPAVAAAPPPHLRREWRHSSPSVPALQSFLFSEAQTVEILAACRERGVTLHSLITAAIMLAGAIVHPEWGSRPIRAFTPVDVRGVVALGRDLMPATGVAFSLQSAAPRDDAWEIAKRVREQMLPQLSEEQIVLSGARTVDLMSRIETPEQVSSTYQPFFGFDILVSNLGIWPFATEYAPLSLRHLWGPVVSVGFSGEQTISLITVNGSLHLLHSSLEPVSGLLDAATTILLRTLKD